jgi:hypothetical protein
LVNSIYPFLLADSQGPSRVLICLATFEIMPVGRLELEQADAMPGSDLEDNVSLACSQAAGLDAIVTRDLRGFAGSTIPVLSCLPPNCWPSSRRTILSDTHTISEDQRLRRGG